MLLFAFYCFSDPSVVDTPSVQGVSTVVCVPALVGSPAVTGASAVFVIHAVVGFSAVDGVLLLLTSLLFLEFPPLLASLLAVAGIPAILAFILLIAFLLLLGSCCSGHLFCSWSFHRCVHGSHLLLASLLWLVHVQIAFSI
jgi:hypothetical protein